MRGIFQMRVCKKEAEDETGIWCLSSNIINLYEATYKQNKFVRVLLDLLMQYLYGALFATKAAQHCFMSSIIIIFYCIIALNNNLFFLAFYPYPNY